MKKLIITLLLIIALICIILVYIQSSSTNNNFIIHNSNSKYKSALKSSINSWNRKLKKPVTVELSMASTNIEDETKIAKTDIIEFSFDKIKAVITIYPLFLLMPEKDKTITLTHEIGHALGIGTQWKDQDILHKKDYPLTIKEFNSKFNRSVESIKIKNGHWDEPELLDDIMSRCGSKSNKISSITIANLKDIGWDL